jgi:hypothetical protein
LAKLQAAVIANPDLATAGITVTDGGVGNAVEFTNSRGERFEVFTANDLENTFGFGTYLTGVNSEVLDTEYQATPGDPTASDRRTRPRAAAEARRRS